MTDLNVIRDTLCRTFCTSIAVNPVSDGFAVSTLFTDRSGDRIGCYVVSDDDGLHIEDDGDYLSHLVGSGVSIDKGQREKLLDGVLGEAGSFWDRDTYEIRSAPFGEADLGRRLVDFLSALIRIRDIEFLSRENVASTFRDDAMAALKAAYADVAKFDENQAVDNTLSEFLVDLVIRPHESTAHTGAIYFVMSNEKLLEASLMLKEIEALKRNDCRVLAIIEDSDMRLLSRRKFQRAQNRSLSMPIFRGDEQAAVMRVGRELGFAA